MPVSHAVGTLLRPLGQHRDPPRLSGLPRYVLWAEVIVRYRQSQGEARPIPGIVARVMITRVRIIILRAKPTWPRGTESATPESRC